MPGDPDACLPWLKGLWPRAKSAATRRNYVRLRIKIPISAPQLPRLARTSEQVTTFASELGEMTKRTPVGVYGTPTGSFAESMVSAICRFAVRVWILGA